MKKFNSPHTYTTYKNKYILIFLLFTLLLFLSFTGCGSSSGSSTPTTDTSKNLIGKISGNGYADRTKIERFFDLAIPKAYAVTTDQPDKIVIISNGKTYKYSISSDGSFTVKTADFTAGGMVALITNDTTKKIFGNLYLNSSNTTDSLEFIDSSKMDSSIDFGTVDTSSASAQITQTISGSNAFSSDNTTVLKQVAKADNSVLLAVNKYVNEDLSTEVFAFFKLGTIADITDKFSSLSGFSKSNFLGNKFGFSGDGSEWQNTTYTDVKIYPPSEVQYGNDSTIYSNTANSTTPIVSTGKNLPDANETGDWAAFSFPYVKSFPDGEWILKVGSTQKGKFRFGDAYPFDSNDKVRAPMPEVKINSNGTLVNSIEVKWFIYDGTEYQAASETVLNTLAGSDVDGFSQFSLEKNNNEGIGVLHSEINSWNATYDLKDKNINISDISHIKISFAVGGVNHKYEFRN